MQQEEKMRMNNQRLGSNGIREVQDGSLLAGTRLKDVRTDANDGAPNLRVTHVAKSEQKKTLSGSYSAS